MRIFISYAHIDKKFVDKLSRRLERYHDVWFDAQLRAGSEWQDLIVEKIAWCECFIYVISKASLSSKYCQQEYEEANRLNKAIVPVRLEGKIELPDHLAKIQYADFTTKAFDVVFADLLGDLGLLELQIRTRPSIPSKLIPHEAFSPPTKQIEAFNQQILNVLPLPFEWCAVPRNHEFEMQTDEGNKGKFAIAPFLLAKYPVTYAQFQAFISAEDGFYHDEWWKGLAIDLRLRSNPGEQTFKNGNHPRENVNWFDAVAFCRWLSARTTYDIRLPTEWEWQWAAQGVDGRAYPWGDEYKLKYANIDETKDGIGPNCRQQTSPVGDYNHNVSPFGVVDMSGNVWEWCLNEYDMLQNTELRGIARRVIRGGSWLNGTDSARVDYRNYGRPHRRYQYGIRILMTLQEGSEPD